MDRFKGAITALVTPFRNGAIDEAAFQRLVERQISAGVSGLVPAGTTGESATLTHDEHRRLIALCVEAAAGRAAVIAGAGSNSTAEAIELARFAESAGADAALAVTGYYNKPSEAGLYAHYKALHDAVDLPIILYNVPGRTVTDLSVALIARLAALPRIIGVKDATGDLARVPLQRLACGEAFLMLSGEDMTAVGFNAMGGVGCIGVTSNVAPDLCVRMQAASLAADHATALALQDRLVPLHDVLFADTSPGPVKHALWLLGLCEPELRLPLAPPSPAVCSRIADVLATTGIDR